MTSQQDKARSFLSLHTSRHPLLLANAWDLGSAKLLESLGFDALATTSGGHAATLGGRDGSVSREEALTHAETLVAGTELPVSADLENCFADNPEGVAETVRLALDAGLAGCSVEDFSGGADGSIYEQPLATERVLAAAEVAHGGPVHLVLTARSENYLHARKDLADTISRLQSFQEAGADVLFAPGLRSAEEIRQVLAEVDLPVSVLALPGVPSVAELAELGVSRVSVGGAFAYSAFGALIEAATELRENGTYGYFERAGVGGKAARKAFT